MSRLLIEPDMFFSYARLYASSVASILAWGFRAKDLDSFWFKDVSKMIEQVSGPKIRTIPMLPILTYRSG